MEVFDFGISWPILNDEEDLFVNTLKSECKVRKLSFLYVDDKNLRRVYDEAERQKLKVKFYLDMASETYDLKDKFTRLTYRLRDSGTKVVDDPDDVRAAADKSITHFDLVRSGIPVPFTVVIRKWEPTRRLSRTEKRGLGFPFIVKPALGYGQKGVKKISQRSPLKDIASARKFNIGDNFLLQQFIDPLNLEGTPAWFRVYNIFGEIIPCWWNPKTNVFRQVTLKEMDVYKLIPLVRIASEIGRIVRVDWFSCEIAINKKNKKFVVIDYMNDQCAVYPQSKHKDGVPDDLVVQMAERIVEKAWHYVTGRRTLTYRAIWFPRMKVKDEDA